MADFDKNLSAYFDKLLEIQKDQQSRPLSGEELKKIALDMGMSQSDWEAVQLTFDNHFKRAEGFLRYRNWEDAIKEYSQALTLQPYDIKTLFGIASAYQGKFHEDQQRDDRELALKFAKDCLEIQADHNGALKLISDLKRKKAKNNHRNQLSSKSSELAAKKSMFFVIAGLLVLMIAGVTMVLLRQTTNPSEVTISSPQAPTTTQEPQAPSLNEINPPEEEIRDNERIIPVSFIPHKGLNLETQSSILKIYDNSFSYNLSADLIPQGIEVDKLKLKIELIDQQGQIVSADFKEVVRDYEPLVRSGDIHPIDYLEYRDNVKAPDIKEVRLSVHIIDQQEAPGSYQVSKQIPFEWASSKPTNYDLVVRERRSEYSQNKYSRKPEIRHELALEFENTGQSRIKKLKIETAWLDHQGNVLASKDNLVAISSRPRLKVDQSRVQYVLGQIPTNSVANIKKYRITVVEIE